MSKKKVYINAGHGGRDPGAVKYVTEKDVNLKIAIACKEYLIACGVDAYIAEADINDESQTASDELREIEKFNPDLAIDIHNNAGGGNGFEVYHSIVGGVGKQLAKNIEDEVKKIGQNSRGIKTRKNSIGKDYYYFIRLTKCPAVICEGAFVDNREDAAQIDEDHECKAFGEAYAKGILKTLGVNLVEASENKMGQVIHSVVKDDNLCNLAQKYNTTVQEIQNINNLHDTLIKIGQTLIIPTATVTDEFKQVNKNEDLNRIVKVSHKKGLNVRSGPGKEFKTLAVLQYGTEVKLIEVKTNWGKIKTGKNLGWICLDYVVNV